MNILVVDPDTDNRDSWALLLQCQGHHVFVATDAPSAKLQCQTCWPDVVLTELVLPGEDGWQLARWLREQEGGRHLLLVAVTWLGRSEDRLWSEQARFDFFLTKPADPIEVQELLVGAGPPVRPVLRSLTPAGCDERAPAGRLAS